MIKHLKGLEINTIYDFDNSFSINELLCKFWEKIEETINISNESIDILNWVKEQGLADEVQLLINQLVADGTIEQMINVDKIEELRTIINTHKDETTYKISGINSQLDNIDQEVKKTNTLINTHKEETTNKINDVNSQLNNIAQEVKKPITLNKCDEEMLVAIQNKEGETTFNLLSIPRDKSVTASKLDLNYIESYTNLLLQPKLESFTFSGGDSAESSPISDVISLQNGNYFGFAEINVSDLKNYREGYIGLRFIHTGIGDCLDFYAGDNMQIFRNGKLYLYGNFNINSECQVKAVVRYWNGPNNISFNFTVNKLYLFNTTSSEKLINSLKKYHYNKEIVISNYINDTSNIGDNCITYNKLDENLKNVIDSVSLTGNNIIDCWGDSLMAGTGGNGVTLPNEIQKFLPNYTINNYGQGGEKAEEIAFRQGSLFAYADPFTLKADGSYSDIKVRSVDGLEFSNLNLQGTYYGNNFVYINGIKCLFRKSENDGFYKVAIAQGIAKDIIFSKKQILIAESFYEKNNNILIICVGQNGWIDNSPSHLCDIVEKMIKKNNTKKFLIISRPFGDKETMIEEEKEYACRFGNNYFNARDYISKYGLLDNNLRPTQQDNEAMNKGAIPPQLLVDEVHGNKYFYKSYAIGVYEHLKHIL